MLRSMCCCIYAAFVVAVWAQYKAYAIHGSMIASALHVYGGVAGRITGTAKISTSYHGQVWPAWNLAPVDVHPPGYIHSYCFAADNEIVVGAASTSAGYHAIIWDDLNGNWRDVNPSHLVSRSYMYGAAGGRQVGSGSGPPLQSGEHALLWSGTAQSAVDLNPEEFFLSVALSVDNGQQVGYGLQTPSSPEHALLWSGSAASCIDLGSIFPLINSRALDTSNGVQVGYINGAFTSTYHAVMWRGTPGSILDINPPGYLFSEASSIANGIVVGQATLPGGGKPGMAFLWNINTGARLNLHSFLSTVGNFEGSYARDIDPETGDIIGTAFSNSNGSINVVWKPTGKVIVGIGPHR